MVNPTDHQPVQANAARTVPKEEREGSEKNAVSQESSEHYGGGLTVRRANLFLLCYTVLSLALGSIKIPGLPGTWSEMVWYIPTLAIALLFCRKEGTGITMAFGFRRVGAYAMLLTVVICIAMHSVAHLVSSLTNLMFPSFM